jgi:hypothetical protein
MTEKYLKANAEYDHIFDEVEKLPKAINSLILLTNQKLRIQQCNNSAIKQSSLVWNTTR